MSAFTVAYLGRLELWGFAAAAIQGWLVLLSWLGWSRMTRDASAGLRHRLACAHFAALVLLPALAIALLHWMAVSASVASPPGTPAAELASLQIGYREALRFSLPVALLWFAGAAVMAWKLFLDASRIARLSRECPRPEVVQIVRRLARGWIHATRPEIRMADITMPIVVGLWRPVLLVPRHLESRLPVMELEAVLLHELAHVSRNDFGWNLLQRLVLVLLWFHPAAWALYRHVSRERELCCDDVAVSRGASAIQLASALVRLAESHARPGLAVAIASPGDLTSRVQRLLDVRRRVAPRGVSYVMATALSVLCLMGLAAVRLGHADAMMMNLCNASAFGPTILIEARDPAGSFTLRIKQGRVIEASIERERLPNDRILQQGDRVVLMGAQQPIVSLTVMPHGRIHWQART